MWLAPNIIPGGQKCFPIQELFNNLHRGLQLQHNDDTGEFILRAPCAIIRSPVRLVIIYAATP